MKYYWQDNKWVTADEWKPKNQMLIIPDIEPYQSMVTGELITSRAKHREHLKVHGCIEIGDEKLQNKPIPDVAPQQRHEVIRSQIDAMRHDDFKQMLKNDLNRIRWNSRS